MDLEPDFKDFDGTCRLFPLPGVVLFPHAVLPLHIFEPRYRAMTEDALAGDRLVAIVQVSPERWDGSGAPPIEPVACLGRILTHERLPDGRFNFLLLGRHRVRILRELDAPTLYRQAEVQILQDIDPEPQRPGPARELVALYRDLAARVAGLDPDLDQAFSGGPPLGVVTDLLAQSLGLPPATKQSLLAEPRVDLRAQALGDILREVIAQLDAKSRQSAHSRRHSA